MNEQRIESRKAGRELASEIIELIVGYELDDWAMESLCEELPNQLLPPEPEPKPPKQLSYAQLETTLMPFGSHEGERFCDVPLDYLDWLCRSQEEFYKSLRAYLRHPENRRKD